MAEPFDVVILGAGPGGYVGAIRAAQLGLRAALVELHVGCVPTKALLHTAETLETIRHSAEIGIQVPDAALDVAAVHRYKDRVVDTLHKGVEYLMRKHGVTVLRGTGRLTAPGAVAVAQSDGSTADVRATHVLLATGSTPRSIPGVEIDAHRILSSDHLVGLRKIPRHLAILGAGAVGVEFASVFRAFGSDVTLVELLPRVLPMEDEEISGAMGNPSKMVFA